jgi:CheY-like chemotaxis protein
LHQAKKHILIVDDDAVILRIYQDGLASRGFKVTTAVDGLAALKAMKQALPDLLVLDLMMPKLSGVDVLKFVRADPSLSAVPVIVFSNAFMNEIAIEANNLGVKKALLKIRCTPARLAEVIEDVLAGRESPDDPNQLLVTHPAPPPVSQEPVPGEAGSEPTGSPPGARLSDQAGQLVASAEAPVSRDPRSAESELRIKVRRDFLMHGPDSAASLRALCDSLAAARTEADRSLRLNNLFRKVHFLVASAGMAGCPEISHLASVFEALLYDLMAKPQAFSPSVLRTCDQTVALFPVLYQRARDSLVPLEFAANVLAVDDDPVCNRLVVAALRHAQLQAVSVDQVQHVLPTLKQTKFDLILLDVEMPGASGFEMCRLIRRLPGYEKIPVIYVTSHDDFANRQSGIASGGDDLISKPILPLELAVKVVTHLLRR